MMTNKLDFLSKADWDVNRYKTQFNPQYWSLVRRFMLAHKSKYPERRVSELAQVFYQIGMKGKRYDAKTTRMVSALAAELEDNDQINDESSNDALYARDDPYTKRKDFKKEEEEEYIKRRSESDDVSSVEGDSWINKEKYTWKVGDSYGKNKNTLESGEFRRGNEISRQTKEELNHSRKKSSERTKYELMKDNHSRKNEHNVRLENSSETNPQQESLLSDGPLYNNIDVAVLKLEMLRDLLEGFVIFRGVNELSKLNNSLETLEESFRCSDLAPCDWYSTKLDQDCGLILVALRWKNTVLAEAVGTVREVLRSRIAKVVLSKIAQFAFVVEAKHSYYTSHGVWMESKMKNMNNIVVTKFNVTRNEMDSFASVKPMFQLRELVLYGQPVDEKNGLIEYVTSKWSHKLRYRKVLQNNGNFVVCFYHTHRGEFLKQKFLEPATNADVSNKYILHYPGKHEIISASNEHVKEKTELYSGSTEPLLRSECTENEVIDDIELVKLLPGFIMFYDANQNSQIEENSFSALVESFKKSDFGSLEIVNDDCGHWSRRCFLKCKGRILAEGEDIVDAQAQANATLNLLTRLKTFSFTIQANQDYFCNGKVPYFMENTKTSQTNEYRIVKFEDASIVFEIIKEFCQKPTFGELIFGDDFPWEVKTKILRYISDLGLNYRYFTSDNSGNPTHMAVYQPVNLPRLKSFLMHNQGQINKYKLIHPVNLSSLQPVQGTPADTETLSAEIATTSGENADNKRKREGYSEEPNFSKKLKGPPPDYICDQTFPDLVLFIGVKHNSKIQTNVMQILNESFLNSRNDQLFVNYCEEDVDGNSWTKCVMKVENEVLVEVVREDKVRARAQAAELLFNYLRRCCYTVQAKESYYMEGEGLPTKCKTQQYLFVKEKKTLDHIVTTLFHSKLVITGIELVFGKEYSNRERKKIMLECERMNMVHRGTRHNNTTKLVVTRPTALPMLKKVLLKTGGENDRYRLIKPGGEIRFPGNEVLPACKPISHPESSNTESKLNENAGISKEENIQITKDPTMFSNPLSVNPTTKEVRIQGIDPPSANNDFFWGPEHLLPKMAKSMFMCRFVRRDSTAETDPCVLLDSTASLIYNVVFKYITSFTGSNQYQAIVGLMLESRNSHPLRLGTGVADSVQGARQAAAQKTVDLLQQYCKVILPNPNYFADGRVPPFILNRTIYTRKTSSYEIAEKSTSQLTVSSIIQKFLISEQQDLFFLSSDFSNQERNEVIKVVSTNTLDWRLFGPLGPSFGQDDLVTTQHVCVYKEKTVLTLVKELIVKGGVTEKYYIKKPEENSTGTRRLVKPEEVLQRSLCFLDDCPDYYNSSCAKNQLCELRHEPKAKVSTTVCALWESSKCFDLHCENRHMKLKDLSTGSGFTAVQNRLTNVDFSVPPPNLTGQNPLSYPMFQTSNLPLALQNPGMQPYTGQSSMPQPNLRVRPPPVLQPLIAPPTLSLPTGISTFIPRPITSLPPPNLFIPPLRGPVNIPNMFTQMNLPRQPNLFQQNFSNVSNVQSSFPIPVQNLSNSDLSMKSHTPQSTAAKITSCVLENQPGGCVQGCGLSHSNILDVIVNKYLESH
uniref:XRN2-binding (XTBD) domain-containing protein n=1 Tax=Graphocephala atropunctata TaxID=36148 RepID=A0A1B6LCB6_9HEMI